MIAELTEQIRSGRLARGEQLPGENQIAEKYQVSRGTVRSALSELQRQELIATRSGVGSFVAFDGVTLDQTVGWATALADSGFDVSTELLSIERTADAELTERFGLAEFVAIRRLRRDRAVGPVSVETSLIPAFGELSELPERGLLDDSITATLLSVGLIAGAGDQRIGTHPLSAEMAALLERTEGELFLQAVRTSVSAEGELVEQVTSLLDPDRFQFHLTFGRP